jgi:formamidopyrimidine-DNA glycosylase
MFELPEYQVIANQINQSLLGKVIRRGLFSNTAHKFVWHNISGEEFSRLAAGKTIGRAYAKGRWLFIPVEPGYVLVLGECGGKFVYQDASLQRPDKYHLLIEFEDGSFLYALTQMWGAYELYVRGEEQQRTYIKDMRPTPLDTAFTFDYFRDLMASESARKKLSAKALLTQNQLIPGLRNSIAQDILFQARLHPRHSVADLDEGQAHGLYEAIRGTVEAVIEKGGRYDEFDLYGQAGGYSRLMDKHAVGRPCPRCGGVVEKIQYLGGSCYLCPSCQV